MSQKVVGYPYDLINLNCSANVVLKQSEWIKSNLATTLYPNAGAKESFYI